MGWEVWKSVYPYPCIIRDTLSFFLLFHSNKCNEFKNVRTQHLLYEKHTDPPFKHYYNYDSYIILILINTTKNQNKKKIQSNHGFITKCISINQINHQLRSFARLLFPYCYYSFFCRHILISKSVKKRLIIFFFIANLAV